MIRFVTLEPYHLVPHPGDFFISPLFYWVFFILPFYVKIENNANNMEENNYKDPLLQINYAVGYLNKKLDYQLVEI